MDQLPPIVDAPCSSPLRPSAANAVSRRTVDSPFAAGHASPSQSLADAAAKESLSGRCRCWLRTKMVCDVDLSCYGIVLDENWHEADESKPVVIVVHGYNSCPARNQAMADAIRAAGFPCGTFAYPNDYTIVASAQLLSSELRRFHREHPDRRVVLVCHSMGGMVARACIEDSLYDPGNVDRVILIAPPTSGTRDRPLRRRHRRLGTLARARERRTLAAGARLGGRRPRRSGRRTVPRLAISRRTELAPAQSARSSTR